MKNYSKLWSLPVIVAALGYFVDIYDLLLFSIVRITSLQSMGLDKAQVSIIGANILNWQMGGLLLGGIFWGILGDKKGRLSVLFGSIITYSLANIACGFVESPDTYKILRFVAGIGLAGELGAGITLVSEILPKQLRALGTSLVAGIGLFGAVVAYFTVTIFDSWRIAYFVGGGLGIALLLLRVGVVESGMFKNISEQKQVAKGDFLSFFTNKDRFYRYMKCIGIGLPTWFVIGILATFSNEFGESVGISTPIDPKLSIMWCYVGLALGDLTSGVLSQYLASRRKAVMLMMLFTLIGCIFYLFVGVSSFMFYALSLAMGFGIGYWAMFVTIGAEQFGTNLRATAATTIPNMVRGAVIPMTTIYAGFKTGTFMIPLTTIPMFSVTAVGVVTAGLIVGVIAFILGFYAIFSISETHGKDLDYLE